MGTEGRGGEGGGEEGRGGEGIGLYRLDPTKFGKKLTPMDITMWNHQHGNIDDIKRHSGSVTHPLGTQYTSVFGRRLNFFTRGLLTSFPDYSQNRFDSRISCLCRSSDIAAAQRNRGVSLPPAGGNDTPLNSEHDTELFVRLSACKIARHSSHVKCRNHEE
jgi:hypothetical protein